MNIPTPASDIVEKAMRELEKFPIKEGYHGKLLECLVTALAWAALYDAFVSLEGEKDNG